MSYYSDLIKSTGPLGYWRLNETSGTTAFDISGNGLNGTYSGGCTQNNGAAISKDGTANSVAFDGISGIVTLPSGLTLASTDAVSIEFWAYAPTANITQTASAFTIGNLDNPNRCQAHWPYSSVFYWDCGDITTTGRVSTSAVGFTNIWNHVCLVSSGSAHTFQAIYINGTPIVSQNQSSSIGTTLTGGKIATFGNWEVIQMAEFAVYNKVLSQPQIRSHFLAGQYGQYSTGLQAGLGF